MQESILIVEDEEKVSSVLKAYLEKEGYKVISITSGIEGIEIFKKGNFKLIILDLMLPDIEGEEVCKIIREISDVHIFMLTAKGDLSNRIEGLNIGADEYLVKPFSPRELTARVNALFRRIGGEDEEILNFNNGKLKINKIKRIVEVEGSNIKLTPNEFQILYTLASNKGKVFTREMLINSALGLDFEGFDRTVDVHIKNIRKKIEKDSRNPKYIVTITRIGYKFGGES